MSRQYIFLISFLITGIPLILLSWLVFAANRKSKVNISLTILCLACTLWLALLFYSDSNIYESSTFLDSVCMVGGCVVALASYVFTRRVVFDSRINIKYFVILFLLMLVVSVLNFVYPGFAGIRTLKQGVYTFDGSIGYYAHSILTFSVLIESFWHLNKKANSSQDKSNAKKYKLIVLGATLGVSLNLLSELVFAVADLQPAKFTLVYDLTCSVGVLIFACFATYAVLKHGLFDTRRAAIRTVAYSATLVIIALCYGVILFVFYSVFFGVESDSDKIIFNVVSAVLVAMTFPYIKNFFDNLTKKLFFKDSYDSSRILGQLNDIFISEQELGSVLKRCIAVISTTLFSSYSEIYAVDRYEVNGNMRAGAQRRGIRYAKNVLNNTPWPTNNILVVNDPNLGVQERQYLEKIGADLILRLSTKDVVVGYLLLGSKLNGDKYNSQDVNLLLTIAKNLGLAIQGSMQFTKIRNFNKTLKNEIEIATLNLRNTNKRVKKISKSKDEMISMVSHQLLPQLTAMQGFMELMQKSPEESAELINLSKVTAVRMTRLTQDILNISKIRLGELNLKLESVDLVKLLNSEIANLKYLAIKRNIKIEFDHPITYIVSIDKVKFSEAFYNILDNSIQYSNENSIVSIILDGIKLTVTDRGIGIPMVDQKKVFHNYFRSDNAKLKRPVGSGVGLFVSNKIFKAHGFNMIIKSEENKGTSVVIEMK